MIQHTESKINSIYSTAFKLSNYAGLNYFQKEFDRADKHVYETVSRERFYVKQIRTRRIWTPYGDVEFERKIYFDRETGKSRKLVDEYLGLDSHKYFLDSFMEKIITSITDVKSYKALSKLLGKNISTTQFSRFIDRYDFNFVINRLSDKQEVVYINLDGMWLHRHKQSKAEYKFAVMHTGSTNEKRPKLLNRAAIPFLKGTSSEQIANVLEKIMWEIYGDVKKVIFVGDGASWITEVSRWFTTPSTRVIDQFHYKHTFNKLFGIKRNSGNKVNWNYWLSLKSKKVFERQLLLKFVDESTGEIIANENQRQLIRWLSKWFLKWKESHENKYICAIEGVQSNLLSTTFKHKRSFAEHRIYKLILMNFSEYNNWKISKETENTISMNSMYNENNLFGIDFFNETSDDPSVPLSNDCSRTSYAIRSLIK